MKLYMGQKERVKAGTAYSSDNYKTHVHMQPYQLKNGTC